MTLSLIARQSKTNFMNVKESSYKEKFPLDESIMDQNVSIKREQVDHGVGEFLIQVVSST